MGDALPRWTLEAASICLGFRVSRVPLEVINEALHLLHGRLVPGEAADALGDMFNSSSVAASPGRYKIELKGEHSVSGHYRPRWPADVGVQKTDLSTYPLLPCAALGGVGGLCMTRTLTPRSKVNYLLMVVSGSKSQTAIIYLLCDLRQII